MTDVQKMYAHIYFDIPKNVLGIAVYSYGRIPGFSGKLSDELKNATQTEKAFHLFQKTMGSDSISGDELQLGKLFSYEEIQDRLNKIDVLGKIIAEDKSAQVLINLDDPLFWLGNKLNKFPEDKRALIEKLPEERKKEIGAKIKESEMGELLKDAKTPNEVQDALQKLYIVISRRLNTKRGPKEYAGTTTYSPPPPPTFLISKERDLAYYPGFRGAQYMRKIPESLKQVHPLSEQDTAAKWHNILVPDTKLHTNGKSLDSIQIEPLDYISEVLARLFFNNLPNEKKLQVMDFNKAISPLIPKAKTLLEKVASDLEEKDIKTASSLVGTWIDLETGSTFKSEQQLLAAQRNVSEKLPLAARLRTKWIKND